MNKKAPIAAVILALLFSAIVLTVSFELAQANPILNVSGVPRIEIVSPKPILYYEDSLTLSFYGNSVDWGTVEYSNIQYTVDGELRGAVDTPLAAAEVYSVNLTGLTDKQHTVEVTAIVTVKSLTTLTGGVKASVLWAPSTFTSSGKLNFTTQAPTPAPTELAPTPTTVTITQTPSNVWLNDLVQVQMRISPTPPTTTDSFTNFALTLKLPDGTNQTIIKDVNGSAILFGNGENMIDRYFNFTSQLGNYTLSFSFLGQTFGNGSYYMPSENQTTFTVNALAPGPTPTPTISPSPSVGEFPAWVASPLLAAVAASAAYLGKNKKKS
jgi:hypothetical protein